MRSLCLALFFVLLAPPVTAADAVLAQRHWMVQVVEALDWSFGLPNEPTTEDYRRILEGKRHFRVEAEEHYHPDDHVSVQHFRSFGTFSGSGWLSGVSSPTVAHLNFNLPLGGNFDVTIALRLPGHQIRVDGRTVEADGEEHFTVHRLGTFTLDAGVHEVELFLPPNSAVDYLDFAAADLPPVQPVAGWRPEEPLTLAVMAETIGQIFALNELLSPAGEPITIEAENQYELSSGADIVRAQHLGEPSGGAWLRAGAPPATVSLSFSLPEAGIYALQVRAAADAPFPANLNDNLSLPVAPAPYLDTVPLGSFILPAGTNTIRFHLPPRAGIDELTLFPTNPERLLILVGLVGTTGPPSSALVESYLALIAAIGGSR